MILCYNVKQEQEFYSVVVFLTLIMLSNNSKKLQNYVGTPN